MPGKRLHIRKWAVWMAVMVMAPAITFAGESHSVPRASVPACRAVSFTASLDAGKSFVQKVGDLAFKITATNDKGLCNGWTFSLEDKIGNDFIYPVNMPLRFNPSQYLGCSYGLTARQGLEMKRRMRFILTERDYLRLDPMLREALWPASSPDPQHAAERYLESIAAVPTGQIRLDTLHYEMSSEDHIRSATFRVELIAPASFHFGPSLKPRPVACQSGP